MIDKNDCDALLRELMQDSEEYARRRQRHNDIKRPNDVIFVYDKYTNRLKTVYAEQCNQQSVDAFHLLRRMVDRIAAQFNHVPPAVGVHNSLAYDAFFVRNGKHNVIVLSVEELHDNPIGAIWTCLHEYMHYVQHDIAKYLSSMMRGLFHFQCNWKGNDVVINLMEVKYHEIPWEAEADAFANANIGFFLNEFGFKPEQFKQPAPLRNSKYAGIRVQPNFNVECKQPEFWYYNTEKSG